ncbi:MAG: SDR family oxidoreductase [Acidimicrobiales bacterium]
MEVIHGQVERPVTLITGSSRGIGAETARLLSRQIRARIVVNYRDKQRRADQVVAGITASGGEAFAIRADLTDSAAVGEMMESIKSRYGRIDILVLNASGGMERGFDQDYALRLNRDAQRDVLELALPIMPPGSRVVFVTSHQAHFYGKRPGIDLYEPVAQSKRAGEDILRAQIPRLSALGVDLVVVSGDMIEGTITVRLLDRANPGVVDARREQVGDIPTVAEFAAALAGAAVEPLPTGHTVYVGGEDYLDAP